MYFKRIDRLSLSKNRSDHKRSKPNSHKRTEWQAVTRIFWGVGGRHNKAWRAEAGYGFWREGGDRPPHQIGAWGSAVSSPSGWNPGQNRYPLSSSEVSFENLVTNNRSVFVCQISGCSNTNTPLVTALLSGSKQFLKNTRKMILYDLLIKRYSHRSRQKHEIIDCMLIWSNLKEKDVTAKCLCTRITLSHSPMPGTASGFGSCGIRFGWGLRI